MSHTMTDDEKLEYSGHAIVVMEQANVFYENLLELLRHHPEKHELLFENEDYEQALEVIDREKEKILAGKDVNTQEDTFKFAAQHMAKFIDTHVHFMLELEVFDKKALAELIPDEARNEDTAKSFTTLGAPTFATLCLTGH